MKFIFILLWIVAISVNGQGAGGKCLTCERGKTLFCRNKGLNSLDSIPKGTNLTAIKRLVLDKNAIKLSNSDIEILNKNFTSLRFLDLRSNRIQTLSSRPLIEHDKLEELNLHGNKIEKVPGTFTSKIPNLASLILSDNRISDIPPEIFDKNEKIRAFDVSDNEITTISKDLFVKTTTSRTSSRNSTKRPAGKYLESLRIAGNKIRDVTLPLLEELESIKGLNIRDNNDDDEEAMDCLNPEIFFKHKSLRFLFTSGYADCCNVRRMKRNHYNKKDWYCSFKSKTPFRQDACALRISTGEVEDTFIGQIEINLMENATKWQKLQHRNWTWNEAKVACQEAGYKRRVLEYIPAEDYEIRLGLNETFFPPDDEAIQPIIWNTSCTGAEYTLFKCNRTVKQPYTALKSRGVGVRCKTPEEKMGRACKGRFYGDEIQCSRMDPKLKNLPWQDKNNTRIIKIDLSNNMIRWIYEPSLKFYTVLEVLILSHNGLGWIANGVFKINSLKILNLANNNLRYGTSILATDKTAFDTASWFVGLRSLESLDLSSNKLSTFPRNVFKPLGNLKNFTMKDNSFTSLHRKFFNDLVSLELLDLRFIYGLRQLDWDYIFQNGLENIKIVKISYFTHCCYVEAYRPNAVCEAPVDNISSCERMIKFSALRVLMWFLVVLTIGGNMSALLMRLVKDDVNKVQNMLICSLSFSDMLMGVYLAGIIDQELRTRGEYYKYDFSWRTGTSCKLFGIISVISSEVSVLTLVIIAYDRFLHIVHAMEFRKIGYYTAMFLVAITWIGCTVIAVLPALIDSYFYDNIRQEGFYGTNSICMPLQLPGENAIAWEYCLGVFGVLNFIGAFYLIIVYCRMFYSSYKSAKDSRNDTRLDVHTTMAKRFAAVVFTDVCCWVPIAMLLILSLVRVVNDGGNLLYMWFSICVIPINSAINPILYTLSTPLFWQKVKDLMKKILFCFAKGGNMKNVELYQSSSLVNRQAKS